MTSKPYLIISDVHLHAWTAFATVDERGVNTRLKIILEAIREAAETLRVAGGHEILIAGDLFHVRGKLAPSVLNPTIVLFEWLLNSGFYISAIPGNHDLEGKHSDRIGNAILALEGIGVQVFSEPGIPAAGPATRGVLMVPWQPTIASLFEILNKWKGVARDVVIHAPLDGVLPHIPSSGLTATKLMQFGFARIFAGHFHNHINFEDRVYSIGALTHQTWADIGTKAGFLLVYPNEVEHVETSVPKFVDWQYDDGPDELLIAGNYVRVKGQLTNAECEEIRKELIDTGARGVTIHPIKKESAIERTGETVSAGMSIEQSIAEYLKSTSVPNVRELAMACQEVLDEARSIEP